MITIGVVDDTGSTFPRLVSILKHSQCKGDYKLESYGDHYLYYDSGAALGGVKELLKDVDMQVATLSLDKDRFVSRSDIAIISNATANNLAYLSSYVSSLIDGKDGKVLLETRGSAEYTASVQQLFLNNCDGALFANLVASGRVAVVGSATDDDLAAFIGLKSS